MKNGIVGNLCVEHKDDYLCTLKSKLNIKSISISRSFHIHSNITEQIPEIDFFAKNREKTSLK